MNVAAGYCSYFALASQPFSIAPDPAFLYPSLPHREALAHLRYGLEREGGFILLTGEVGTGKTTLTRLLLQQLPQNIDVAYVLSTHLDVAAMLDGICTELCIECAANDSIKSRVDALNQSLMQRHAAGKRVLLVVEEAQTLASEVLEFLRLLTNLETDTHKLLHILLVGQPELLETIGQKSLRQLDQRVVARYHLRPLRLDELEPYVAHRLERCGATTPLFERAALRQLHKASGGIPRLINLIAERCLVGAFAAGRRTVCAALVRAATREVLGSAPSRALVQRRIQAPAVALAIVAPAALVFVLWQQQPTRVPEFPAPPQTGSVVAAAAMVPAAPTPPAHGDRRSSAAALLARWGIDEPAADMQRLCGLARDQGLACLERSGQSLRSLRRIGLPAVLELATGADARQFFLVDAIDRDFLVLGNGEQQLRLAPEELEARWDGVVLLLWRAPVMQRPLVVGDSDRILLDWVQAGLSGWQPQRGIVVNGGSYTEELASEVQAFQREHDLQADGIIGLETALMLSRYQPGVPRLDALVPREPG